MRRGHADPIAPLTLCGVQRRIGSLQEGLLAAGRGIRGDPNTDRESAIRHEILARERIAFHLLTQALTDFLRAHTISFGENNRELFYAPAGDRVRGATHLLKQSCKVLQDDISL